MKRSLLVFAMCSSQVAFGAEFTDVAQVVDVQPMYISSSVPRQNCFDVQVPTNSSENSSPAGAIIGGLAGALLGSTVGKGDGRKVAIAIGAGVGAVTGDRMSNRDDDNHAGYRTERRCETQYIVEQRLSGYMVTVNYKGRPVQQQMLQQVYVGQQVQVRVSLSITNPTHNYNTPHN